MSEEKILVGSISVHWLRNIKASAAMQLNTTGWNMERAEVLISNFSGLSDYVI